MDMMEGWEADKYRTNRLIMTTDTYGIGNQKHKHKQYWLSEQNGKGWRMKERKKMLV